MRGKTNSTIDCTTTIATRDSVFDEGLELMVGAVIIYIFAELRNMVREGTVNNLTLSQLEPPLTASQTLELIQTHKQALAARAGDHEYLESRLQALAQAYSSPTTSAAMNGTEAREPESTLPFCSLDGILSIFRGRTNASRGSNTHSSTKLPEQSSRNDSIVLSHFVDHKSQEEIVHAIVVNFTKKRVSIIFRGSVTNKDFLQDAKCAQRSLPNPVLGIMNPPPTEEQMPSTIRVHTGFWEYLFQKSPEGVTRMDQILQDAKTLLKENVGFSLYMTGHSLGGALSTLCAFYAACDDEMLQLTQHKRIVVYSVASPYCGNWKFRHAFQELERNGRLQHLRIANREDLVTLMPFAVPKPTILSPALSLIQGAGNLYKHVGINLRLERKEDLASTVEYKIKYPRENQCDTDYDLAKDLEEAIDSGKSFIRALYHLCKTDFARVEKFHSCAEYEERFESCRAALKSKTLDDLYFDPSITGKLFAKDYQLAPLPKDGFTRAMRAFKALGKSNKDNKIPPLANEEEEMTLTQAASTSR